MSKDDQPNTSSGLQVVSVAGRTAKGATRNWVQATPGLPMREVLLETSVMLGCITALTRQAIDRPGDASTLLRATHYMGGMAKAMIEGQLAESTQGKPRRT